MQPITNYSSDAFLRLALQGPPGSGKTTTACQFPGAYIVDCDLNLGGPKRWLEQHGKVLPLGYDIIDRDEKDVPIPLNLRLLRLQSVVKEATKDEKIKTIVFDSATKIGDYIKDDVLRRNPTKTGNMEMPSWGFYYATWVSLVGQVTAAKVNSVFIFHEQVDKDEVEGSTRVFLNVQGSFKHIAGALFTDVWRAETVEGGDATKPTKFMLRTTPNYKFALKNSLGLPPLWEFNWAEIESRLKGEAK